MQFPVPLVEATLIRRYKRFLADVQFADGRQITVHCPNTGSMRHCAEPGSRVWLLKSDNPRRKYAYTWELVEPEPGHLACIHSARANELVAQALQSQSIPELQGYQLIGREVRYGEENSRIDLLLEGPKGNCYVEIKSVTLHMGQGVGLFPDAVSTRGARHLRELERIVKGGEQALLIFCVQHTAITRVSPAWEIDPVYAQTLARAMKSGVRILALAAHVRVQKIEISRTLDFALESPL